jgi:aminomethyltransferase
MESLPLTGRYAPDDAEMIEVYGFGVPLVATDPVEEYTAIRTAVGLIDFTPLLKLDVRGAGAVVAVDRIVARDLSKMQPGRIAYGPIVNDEGGMLDDSTCMIFSPDHIRIVGGPLMPKAIEDGLSGTSLQIQHLREQLVHITIQGPKSRALLEAIADVDVSNEAFPYYSFKDGVHVGGIPVFLTRMGFTAELGYEVYAARDDADRLWDVLMAAGEPLGVRAIGAAAVMMARIEAGMVMGEGLEYDESITPWECNLGWAVALGKPEFRGRDALAAKQATVTGRVVTVRLDKGEDAATGAVLTRDGSEVGRVTMAVSSPHLGFATLGLARVHRDAAAVGTRLVAEVDGEQVAAEVLATPVYDPERKRVRS